MAHMRGTPHVPSLGDRGGCALKDTCYIRAHYQDTESKQLYLIHRNKHREAAKMRRERSMAQIKGQIKTPERELNEMELSYLSDAEFKTLVIRMFKKLSEDLKSIKMIQSEMKVTLIEITIFRNTTVEWMKPHQPRLY